MLSVDAKEEVGGGWEGIVQVYHMTFLIIKTGIHLHSIHIFVVYSLQEAKGSPQAFE